MNKKKNSGDSLCPQTNQQIVACVFSQHYADYIPLVKPYVHCSGQTKQNAKN